MVTRGGQIKLGDFGVSLMLSKGKSLPSQVGVKLESDLMNSRVLIHTLADTVLYVTGIISLLVAAGAWLNLSTRK